MEQETTDTSKQCNEASCKKVIEYAEEAYRLIEREEYKPLYEIIKRDENDPGVEIGFWLGEDNATAFFLTAIYFFLPKTQEFPQIICMIQKKSISLQL